MPILLETQRVFANLPANNPRWQGDHLQHQSKASMDGIFLGTLPFDPFVHDAHDIDPLAAMGFALGEDHVRQVFPHRSLITNVVIDSTGRLDAPAVTESKARLARGLSDCLDETKGSMDLNFSYRLVSPESELNDGSAENIPVNEREFARTIGEFARNSLTFVISDFNRMRFDRSPDTDFGNVVAIKVNNPLERQIPANIGPVPLGGLQYVDTNKRRKLEPVNRDLQAQHERIVRDLCSTGASVASIIFNHRMPEGFDVDAADAQIAAAIRSKL